tara:strand:- start:23529 stop:24233 length:705 start_codon:yes stop_codon:yes gene_type:complete
MNLEEITSLMNTQNDFSIITLLFSLFIGLILSLAIRWHFKNFGSTLSNREEFSQVFPFILLTTILIITVVKSSIALSLGLVGALSIVRFRTPIKEPEELAYLFISIAAGLGLGAGQILPTVCSVVLILGFMVLLRQSWKKDKRIAGKNLFISIDLYDSDLKNSDKLLAEVNEIITKYTRSLDLRRYDARENSTEIVYLIDLSDVSQLMNISTEIKSLYPTIGITFLDQNNLPSV